MRTRLAVPDISCSGCKASIEGALRPVAGVEDVDVDVAGRIVDVIHDPGLDADRLVGLVEEQGYEVAAREEVA
ncbi:MAG: heavy-metal-associated domain-containing protein [Gaiellaceae bacterium]